MSDRLGQRYRQVRGKSSPGIPIGGLRGRDVGFRGMESASTRPVEAILGSFLRGIHPVIAIIGDVIINGDHPEANPSAAGQPIPGSTCPGECASAIPAEADFQALAGSLRDGILIADPAGQVLYANHRVEDLLGKIPASLQEMPLPFEFPQNDGLSSPTPRIYEVSLPGEGGQPLCAEVTASAITWRGSKAALLVLHDVSGVKRRETEIVHRNYELELIAELSSAMRQVDERSEMASMVLERSLKLFDMESGLLAFNRGNQLELAAANHFPEKVKGQGFTISDSALWGNLLTGEPLIIEDTLMDQPYNLADLRGMFPPGRSFLLLIPLRAADELNGLLMLFNGVHKEFSTLELRLMTSIADMTATALERMGIFETLEQRVAARTRELSALFHVTAVANEYGEAAIIFSQALQETLAAVGCMTGGIFIQEADKSLKLAARQGGTEEFFNNLLNLPDPPWTDQVMNHNRPVMVPDIRQEPAFGRLTNLDNSSFIGVPVRSGSQVLGCMAVIGEEFERFTLEDVSLLISIGEQIGTAAVKVRLQNQTRQLAVDRERRRLARDLHDSVTQQIYSLTLFAGAAEKHINLGDSESGIRYVKRIEEVAEQALKGMRLLIFELRPTVLKSVGLCRALRQRLESVEQRAGIGFEMDAPENLPLATHTEESLYHIATEALNNSLRHSRATRVKISLKAGGGRICLEVTDNGQGMDAQAGAESGGLGMRSMRERTEMLGGSFNLSSTPGQGTLVRVEIEDNHG